MGEPKRMVLWVHPDKVGLYEQQDDGSYRLVEQATAHRNRDGTYGYPGTWTGVSSHQCGYVVDPAKTLRPDLYRKD